MLVLSYVLGGHPHSHLPYLYDMRYNLLCVICGGENDTNGCHLAGFRQEVAFAHHLLATHPPPTLPPCRSAIGIGYISKNYLKWQEIQLAIYPILIG